MKIWIDLANSPQVLFFKPIINNFLLQDHDVEITTRSYAQTTQLADYLGIRHSTVGRHGGKRFAGLIQENFLRAGRLVEWARSRDFDLAVSHNSYSQVVAARLLKIPSVTLMDYEHQPLNHLAFRLANKVIVPEVFPGELLKRYGAGKRFLTYPGIKEQVYLAGFKPTPNYRSQQGFPPDTPLVVIRPPATWTAYHRFNNDLFDELVGSVARKLDRYVLFLPRIAGQAENVKRIQGVHVADRVYDGPNLLYCADVVISGGGTMNRESAVLGTPTYTVFKGKPCAVDGYLIMTGRLSQISEIREIPGIKIEMKYQKVEELQRPGLVRQVTDLILNGTSGCPGTDYS